MGFAGMVNTMLDFLSEIIDFAESVVEVVISDRMKDKSGKKTGKKKTYDKENSRPVLKCSICNGEQVAGFKDIHTGKFEEVMLIRSDKDLKEFMETYGIEAVSKEY